MPFIALPITAVCERTEEILKERCQGREPNELDRVEAGEQAMFEISQKLKLPEKQES